MTELRSGVDTLTRRAAVNCNVYCKPEQGWLSIGLLPWGSGTAISWNQRSLFA
jgi:hypothetical protein